MPILWFVCIGFPHRYAVFPMPARRFSLLPAASCRLSRLLSCLFTSRSWCAAMARFVLPNGLFRAVACLGFATIWPLGSSLNWASRNQLFTQCLLGLACDGFLFRKYSPLFETTCRYNDFICIFAKDMLRPCILKRARITHVFIIFAKSGRQNRGCAILQGSDCMLTVCRRAHTLETIG